MNSIDGFKICRKGLHRYLADEKQCPECRKISVQRWRDANAERHRANIQRWKKANPVKVRESDRRRSKIEKRRISARKYYLSNKVKCLEDSKRWRTANKVACRNQARSWRQANTEKIKAYQRKSGRKWRKLNPDRVRTYAARRRALKKRATPPWANHAAIKEIYTKAMHLEKKTGIPHHVDHIYPLSSPYLCGLHIAENLQVITGSENCSKGNRSWPGQLDCQKHKTPEFLAMS